MRDKVKFDVDSACSLPTKKPPKKTPAAKKLKTKTPKKTKKTKGQKAANK
jgi:hypothetical protein